MSIAGAFADAQAAASTAAHRASMSLGTAAGSSRATWLGGNSLPGNTVSHLHTRSKCKQKSKTKVFQLELACAMVCMRIKFPGLFPHHID